MGFKKIHLAVDCKDAKEQEEVQKIFDKLSNILRLNGKDIIDNAPMIEKNQILIREMFVTMQKNGLKGIMSLLPLALKFKK